MRSKLWLLTGVALAGAATLYCATQAWVVVDLVSGAAAVEQLSATGQELNQSISPISLAALAAAIALTIAGRAFRRALGVLVALLGVAVIAIAVAVLSDPTAGAASLVAEATGLSGASQGALIARVQVTGFSYGALCAGVVLAVLGVLIVILGGKWRAAGRKYEPETGPRSSSPANPDRISDWESMNAGDDPTRHT